MAFDSEAFLAAFLERSAEGIDRRGAEARKYEEEKKATAERNASLVQRRKQTAQSAAQLGRQLKNMGVSDSHIATAMSSGMGGIQDLYNKVNQAVSQRGIKRLGEDDIQAIVSMPTIPGVMEKYQDMGIDAFAAQTYGAVGQAAPAPKQASFMGKLFGFGGKERVDQKLSEQQYADGMSYADINAAARLSDYQSLFPEATMTFTDIPAYGRTEKSSFADELRKAMDDGAYGNNATNKIEAAVELASRGNNSFSIADADKVRTDTRTKLEAEAAISYIEQQIDLYGAYAIFNDERTVKRMKDAIGINALNALREMHGIDIPENEATSDQNGNGNDDDNEGAGNEGDKKPKTKTNEDLLQDTADTETTSDDPFPPAPALDEEGKAVVEDALSGKAILSGTEDKYTDKYTKEQWKQMSRKQRRERGLPETPLGGMNFYFREDVMDMIKEPAKNLQIKRNMDKPTYKINIKGRGTYHVTADQLESINDSYFRGSSPAIIIEEYEDGEKKAKNITKPVLKAIGVE